MELKQLQSLAAVIRCRSFTKAAEKLYISQPTISTHIRMLEEELGTRLIVRTTKSIEVTPHGEELYECACKMLELKDNLVERWQQENQKILRLGVSTIPADYILPEVFPPFRKERPDIQFHIHQCDSKGVIEGILDGSYAVGMIGMESTDERVEAIPFCKDGMVMITPAQKEYENLREEELLKCTLEQPVILREQGSGSKKCIEAYFENMHLDEKNLHVIARLNDQESIKKLVAEGLGISFISEKAVSGDVREGKVYAYHLPGYKAERNLYLAYRKDYVFKDHVRRFIQFVQEYYKGEFHDQ